MAVSEICHAYYYITLQYLLFSKNECSKQQINILDSPILKMNHLMLNCIDSRHSFIISGCETQVSLERRFYSSKVCSKFY